MRSATSSSLSPSSTAAAAWASGAVAVEPSRRGMFSRVKTTTPPSAPGVGVEAACCPPHAARGRASTSASAAQDSLLSLTFML